MSDPVRQFVILGVTQEGQRFRPSDWAERLAGVLAQFRPEGSPAAPYTYSPYAQPSDLNGVRCVIIDHRLRELEPLAWRFAYDFAISNNLEIRERELPAPQAPA